MNLTAVFLLATVMIDAMGVGLIMPVMPDLIQEVSGGDLASAAQWGGLLSTVFAVMQFLFGTILGALSDRYGGRPVLLVSLVVMSLDYLIMAVAGSIWLLLLGRIIGGITSATQATAYAFMADLSDDKDKSANFGLIGAAFGLGFVLGPLVGGLLAEYGTRAPFYAAAILAGLNAALGWVVLRETVTDSTRRRFDWRRANPFGAFKVLNALPGIGSLLVVYFLYQVAFIVYPATWSFFTQESFDWSPKMIGLSLALFGIMMAVIQGGLIRPILRILGERGAVIYGHLLDVVAFGVIAFISSGTLLMAFIPLAAFAGIITPALQGIMSKAVGQDRQGELQGAIVSVTALATIVSPTIMTTAFATFTRDTAPIYLPGAPYILSAGLMLVALLVFLRARPTAT